MNDTSQKHQDIERLHQLMEHFNKMVPSPTELAMIAATLSHGRVDKSDLAQEAIALWADCRNAREAQIATMAEESLKREAANAKPQTYPMPSKFPVPLNEFLRLALPDAKNDFREKTFLNYLDDALRIGRIHARVYPPDGVNKIEWEEAKTLEPPTTPKERTEKWRKYEQNGITEQFYETLYISFQQWRKSTNRKIKSANAKSGHEKKLK